MLVYTNNLDGVGHPVTFYDAYYSSYISISDSSSNITFTNAAKTYLESNTPSKIRFRYTTQIDLASCLDDDDWAAFTIQVPKLKDNSIPFTISLKDDAGNVVEQYQYDPTYTQPQISPNIGLQTKVKNRSTSTNFYPGSSGINDGYGYSGDSRLNANGIDKGTDGTQKLRSKVPVYYSASRITQTLTDGTVLTFPRWENYSEDLYLFYFRVKPGKYTVEIEEDETLDISGVSYSSGTLSIDSIGYRTSTSNTPGHKFVASILNAVQSGFRT